MTSTRKVFAPMPARALRDQRLSGLQLRLLGAIALFDRMGRNGQGCWAGHEKLAEIAGCAYTSVSTELRWLREYGYITTNRHEKNRRMLVHHVIYNDEDSRGFRKRDSSANAEPSDSSASAEQFGKTPDNTSTGFATFSNGNNDRRVAIDREARDSAKAEKYSAKAALVASRHACVSRKAKPAKQNPNIGATLAIIERSLRAGESEYLTSKVAEELEVLAEDYGSGDPIAGRAWRLLNEYEFPL